LREQMPKLPVCSKKSYQEPSLRVYGDIVILTEAKGRMSMRADGGSYPTNRTR